MGITIKHFTLYDNNTANFGIITIYNNTIRTVQCTKRSENDEVNKRYTFA